MTTLLAVGLVTLYDLVVLPRISAEECVQYRSEFDRLYDHDGRGINPDSAACAIYACTVERRVIDRLLYPDSSTRERTAAPCD